MINKIYKNLIHFVYVWLLNNNQKKLFDVVQIITIKYGYWKSLICNIPCNNKGRSLPWYTYPAIEYLSRLDFSDKNIFEWGCGYSSLYWSNIAKKVVSIEDNKEWYSKMLAKKKTNMKIIYCKNESEFVSSLSKENYIFDLIIVDGSNRKDCLKEAITHISPFGVILLDNSDWYLDECKKLRDNGFTEISFAGFGPQVNYTFSTSIFFKGKLNFKYNDNVRPIGGLVQNAK